MQSLTVSNQQSGFTLVEVVAVMVIVVVLAASAIPRMGPSDFSTRTAADRVLAALQYAQVLAQRQGGASVAIAANNLTVKQKDGSPAKLATEDPSGNYTVDIHPSVNISAPCLASYVFGVNGAPLSGSCTYNITGNGMSFTIKVESTGFAHFV